MPDYDATRPSSATLEDCQNAVGRRASLTLTGTIVDAGESGAGAFVLFEVDERWGFRPNLRLGMDLECFELQEPTVAVELTPAEGAQLTAVLGPFARKWSPGTEGARAFRKLQEALDA